MSDISDTEPAPLSPREPEVPSSLPSFSSSSSSSSSSSFSLSFDNSFSHDWTIASNRVDSGRAVCEKLHEMLLQRAKIEEDYGNHLEQIALKFDSVNVEASGVLHAIQALKSETLCRAHQSKDLGEAIRKDILAQTLGNTILNHKQVLYQIKTDGVECQKALEKAVEYQHECGRRYRKIGEEAEQVALKCQNSDRQMPSLKTELATLALRKCAEVTIAREEYEVACLKAKETSISATAKIHLILRSLNDMDLKRMLCLKDSLRKFMIHETACLRNIQYEHCASIEAIEAINPQQEIDEFISRFKSANSRVPMGKNMSFEPLNWTLIPPNSNEGIFKSERPSQVARSILSKSYFRNIGNVNGKASDISEVPDPPDSHVVSKLEEQFDEKLELIWNGSLEAFSGFKPGFVDSLQSSLKRFALCRALESRKSSEKLELSSIERLQALGALCELALDWSEIQNDAWTGRAIMVLSQRFGAYGKKDPQISKWSWDDGPFIITTSDDENGQDEIGVKYSRYTLPRYTLHRCIYHHKYFNKVSFWEEALTITISEDFQKKVLSSRWQLKNAEEFDILDRNYRRTNPYLSSLASFGFAMVTFGIHLNQVKLLLTSVCKKYCLNEDYLSILSECLSNFPLQSIEPKTKKQPISLSNNEEKEEEEEEEEEKEKGEETVMNKFDSTTTQPLVTTG